MSSRLSRADWIAKSIGLSATWTGSHLVILPGWSRFAFSIRVKAMPSTKLFDAVERSRQTRDHH